MDKRIIYILRSNPDTLPPVIAQLSILNQLNCKVDLLCIDVSEAIVDMFKESSVTIIPFAKNKKESSNGIISKIKKNIAFYLFVNRFLKNNVSENTILWIGSADTAFYLKKIFYRYGCRNNHFINLFELYDQFPKIRKCIYKVVHTARKVIVPEINRAHIVKCWFDLPTRPVVIPNKPYYLDYVEDRKALELSRELLALGKKIILYQGWVSKDRDISTIAEAIDEINKEKDEFVFAIMGKSLDNSLQQLKEKYKCIHTIDFLSPPQHLFITAKSYIGIATYDDSSLNNIFCAPNKIYEYSKFSIPMLCRDIPGLSYTVGSATAGECCDTNDVDSVKIAIRKIDADYNCYSQNALKFYNSIDLKKIVSGMMADVWGRNDG